MTQAQDSRRDRKKAEVRKRIIAAGIELISRQGIDAVTVDQIAAAADVGKGTIYNYFETKEEIVLAFLTDFEQQVQKKLQRITRSKDPADAVLAAFIRLQLKLKRPHRQFIRNQFVPYLAAIQGLMDPTLEALFGNLQKRGAIAKGRNLAETITAFKTFQIGLMAEWAMEGQESRQVERTLKSRLSACTRSF